MKVIGASCCVYYRTASASTMSSPHALGGNSGRSVHIASFWTVITGVLSIQSPHRVAVTRTLSDGPTTSPVICLASQASRHRSTTYRESAIRRTMQGSRSDSSPTQRGRASAFDSWGGIQSGWAQRRAFSAIPLWQPCRSLCSPGRCPKSWNRHQMETCSMF